MNTHSVCKTLSTAGAALALSVGLASPAAAQVPVFTVDSTVLGGTSIFDASFIAGTSSSLLEVTSPTTIAGQGWINFSGFENNGTPVGGTGIFSAYTLWVEFDYVTTLVSGTIGTAGSVSQVTDLNYTVYGVAGTHAGMFTAASATDLPPTAATVTQPAGTQEIGGGTLISGSANFNDCGDTNPATVCAGFNATATYANTAFGDTFFVNPKPFYDISFNEFNNTAQGPTFNLPFISLVSASGGVDFNTAAVPEPASLALFGLGLAGFGVASYRRRKHH